MSARTIVSLMLLAGINLSIASANQGQANRFAPETSANATHQHVPVYLKQSNKLPTEHNSTGETLETAPTITSVHHQVWTSSSSGRLDELSPEVISKLRNDVPFLAAYALRPRLVGASSSPSSSHSAGGSDQQSMASLPYETTLTNGEQRSALVAPTVTGSAPLDVGASSPQAARQSLVPKLGDFSEFNVETTSLSKSEHHHKRKTSLKRPKNNKSNGLSSARLGRKRAPKEDSLSQLVRRVKRKQRLNNKRSRSTSGRRQSSKRRVKSKGRSSKRKSSKRRGSSKRSRSSRRRSNDSSRRGARLLQDRPAETNDLGGDEVMRSLERGDSTADGSGVKGGPTATSGGDVKGGSGTTRKPPFFAGAQRPKQADKSPDSVDSGETDRKDVESDSPNAIGGATNGGSEADDFGDEDETEIDDEPQAEPRRVGDNDVEEDGDTVLVEPKSDGVDDDPPVPDLPEGDGESGGPDEKSNGADGDDDARGKETTPSDSQQTTTPAPLAPEGDPRGNRVNRQKPNVLPTDEEVDRDGSNGGDGQDQTAGGGGIGATIGGGGPTAPADGRGKQADANDDDDDDSGGRGQVDGNRSKARGVDRESGVEFANDDELAKDDEQDRRGPKEPANERTPEDGFDGDDRKSISGGNASDGAFGERRQNDGSSRGSVDSDKAGRRPGSSTSEVDGDEDLDYRDELEKTGQKGPPSPTTGNSDDDLGKRPGLKDATATGVNSTKQHSKTGVHCDDGSYDHHGHHGDHHHHHHDTIDWLRGSIPGEPDDDYPILSRVNVTNFSCADQKHPGYYADVDARCQIFHICQADGRQDSFLCPNGTIFSQKSLVCVWWNGFHCEDAPKFYHLNELLYKTTNGNDSPQAVALPNLRPLDGAHARPRSMKAANDGDTANADEDDSPIDGAQATMRGRRPHESGFARGEADGPVNRNDGGLTRGQADARNNIGPDDDATIQRKSTNLDEDSVDELPARLRARDRVPRRRRRASMRQAPPKLKSRRVSRNSRRRKLRHGIKPRRRA